MSKTKFGRYVYAIGSNEKAAHLTGINVKPMKVAIYAITGALTSLAAFVNDLIKGILILGAVLMERTAAEAYLNNKNG